MPDIDFQRIELNLIPKQGDEPVIFYASQYETTRPFIADLFWGDTEFTPGDDCWAEIDIRKNDDNLVVITEDVAIDNNEVSVILPVQALTCIGKNLGQVKIYAGEDQLIAALNFILEVQPDPLAGGVTSETDIDNLTQQIEDIAEEVIGEDYYDKTEVDALLADKADVSDLPDMSNYYTKSQIDNTLINNYATYGYLGSHYYNKASVENLISDAVTLRGEAEGHVASFNTALAELPDTLNSYFNVPGGISELNIIRVGINQWDEEWRNGYYNIDGTFSSYSGNIANKNMIPVNPNTAYYFVTTGGNFGRICWYKADGTFIRSDVPQTAAISITSPNEAFYLNFDMTGAYGASYNNDISINYPATDHIYHTYEAESVTVDLNGTYTEGYVDPLNGKLYDTSVTPAVEHDITRKWIYQAEGVNNFFSDGNDKTYVKYKDTIQHYIDTRV